MPKIAVIGSGLIGRQWAMVFASSPENRICLYDVESSQLDGALTFIKNQLSSFESQGFLRGSGTADEQFSRIYAATNLSECLKDAYYVQECAPEVLELKKEIFEKLDSLASENSVICSSSSCIVASKFTETLKHRHRCMVAHPVNPPYFLPLVELVPAPWTDETTVTKVKSTLEAVGDKPVVLRKEIDGFAVNRLQYPIINEAWNLVQSGVMTAEDVDKVMFHGLGPRYAFYGPLAVMQMNASGIEDYCNRYKSGMQRVSKDLGGIPEFDGEALQQISREMNAMFPVDGLDEERKSRDIKLASLMALKRKIE